MHRVVRILISVFTYSELKREVRCEKKQIKNAEIESDIEEENTFK